MRDSVTCSLTLRDVNKNRYVKCPVHFFRWDIFHSLRYEQIFLTNRTAGKQMNIKTFKLYQNVSSSTLCSKIIYLKGILFANDEKMHV